MYLFDAQGRPKTHPIAGPLLAPFLGSRRSHSGGLLELFGATFRSFSAPLARSHSKTADAEKTL